jgi:ribosomal protein S18 acetylase RimI-like enzyme
VVTIRSLNKDDIQPVAAAFADLGWNKPVSQYERYLVEQKAGRRVVLVATMDGVFAGYVTVVWESGYPPFRESGIPEIVDFNVLPNFRHQGIGTQLMDAAEARIAERSAMAGIGVGLTADYGAAQILYAKRGYLPDGRGIYWDGNSCHFGDQIRVDDSLVLYFTKVLK